MTNDTRNTTATSCAAICLLGEHLLAQQMAACFEHEGIACTVYTDPAVLAQNEPSGYPVIVWSTDTRRVSAHARYLRSRGFSVHRYWIGGDVLRFQRMGMAKRWIARFLLGRGVRSHTASAPWLSQELREMGIGSEAIPFSSVCCSLHWPLAQRGDGPYTVLHYSLPGNDHIYRPNIGLECARMLPDVRFVLVGDPEAKACGTNVLSLGRVTPEKMRALYSEADCLLRITTHDGFPRMVIEAMASGLDVVTNLPVPHTHHANDERSAVTALRTLSNRPAERNVVARIWVLEHCGARHWAAYWRQRLGFTGGAAG